MLPRRPLALLLVLLLPLAGCKDRDGEAQSLFDHAGQAVQQGRALEASSWTDALVKYEVAEADLVKLRTTYPSTPAAAQANAPATTLGPITVGGLENAVLQAARTRAEAEANPLVLAGHLAEAVAAPGPRVAALARVAASAAALDDMGTAQRAIDAATATAAGLPVGSPARVTAWGEVATAMVAANQLEPARELVLANGLPDAWQRLAIAYARQKQASKAAEMVAHAVGGSPAVRAETRATIATALFKVGDVAAARPLMTEAETYAASVPPADAPRVSRLLATAYAEQQGVAQAEAWLGRAGGLAGATTAELDALVVAYQGAKAEAKLLARAHADLTTLEAGTDQTEAVEVPWLANAAYVQGRLGEKEPAAFTLSRARLLADSIAADASDPEALALEAATLRGIAVRLFALGQAEPAREALTDAESRIVLLPPALADAANAETAAVAARLGEMERAMKRVLAIANQAALATALAQAAEAADGTLTAPASQLHTLIARFDPGAPGLTPGSLVPAASARPAP